MKRSIFAAIISIGLAGSAWGADFSDPTWPCIQRKVENLSAGLMWPHPIPESALSAKDAEQVKHLVATLSLRRVTLEEAETYIQSFVETRGSVDKDVAGLVFGGVFDRLNRKREQIIGGIGRYAGKQTGLSDRIDVARTEMAAILAQDAPDFDRVDALEEQIDWDERIYTDRARSLTYVCETPVLLEKRIFALGKLLLASLPQ